ncbi:MAG: hypothetical protein RL410_133 [Actinomycetota bacterium]|jgi:uncharacterized membrane protein YeiH
MFTELPTALDLAAIATGALFGTALAVSRRMPIVGVLVLSVISGLGGGILRDWLLGVPVVAIHDQWYITTAVLAAIFGLPLARRITEHPYIGLILDGLVLGLYVLVGTEKAVIAGTPFAASVFVGLMTAVGGGTVADLLVGERPQMLKTGPWFASAALVGALLVAAGYGQAPESYVGIATIGLVAFIRIVSVRAELEAPSVEMLKQWRSRGE